MDVVVDKTEFEVVVVWVIGPRDAEAEDDVVNV